MDHVRFGIVGMGIGKSQARGILKDPRGRVTALCDLDARRMEEFLPELPGAVKQYTDHEAMCADPEVDAVFIGTPNQLHVPVALAAVRAGKHVLCTKPLSDSEAAARELVAAPPHSKAPSAAARPTSTAGRSAASSVSGAPWSRYQARTGVCRSARISVERLVILGSLLGV
jgi:hypothetical protein